jgi:hypothetical protein
MASCHACSNCIEILQSLLVSVKNDMCSLKYNGCVPEEDVPFGKDSHQGAPVKSALVKRLHRAESRVAVEDPIHSLTFVSTGVSAIELLEHSQDDTARNRKPWAGCEPNNYCSFMVLQCEKSISLEKNKNFNSSGNDIFT